MNKQELKEIIQSSNLNFLLGAGLSRPFLPILNDIEMRLTDEKNETKRIGIYKEYFEKIMLPNLYIIEDSFETRTESNFRATYENYKKFFEIVSLILLRRKSTILSKQANIFTTNIDIFCETALEESNLEYNSGFSGLLNPKFGLSNFKKSISKRSLHFENVSEIPVFNLIKMHGSLTWYKKGDDINFSRLTHIDRTALKKGDKEFMSFYEKIAIINPEPKKLRETVIDLIYYELLRMYSSELEKENTVLFVLGFSMSDQHIREITVRAANSNPTLKIYVFAHSKDRLSEMSKNLNIGELRYSNIEIICPENDNIENKYDFKKINCEVFEPMLTYYHDDNSTNSK